MLSFKRTDRDLKLENMFKVIGEPKFLQSWPNTINQWRTTGFHEKMGIYILY